MDIIKLRRKYNKKQVQIWRKKKKRILIDIKQIQNILIRCGYFLYYKNKYSRYYKNYFMKRGILTRYIYHGNKKFLYMCINPTKGYISNYVIDNITNI
jgi:hypothetical protein